MKQRWLLASLLLLVFAFAQIPLVCAQQTSYDGLDIIFLTDQSDSMGRLTGGVAPNDRQGLRFYSLKYATQLMGEFALSINPDASFRMGVINFGETTEIWNFAPAGASSRYWQTISPTSRDQWKPEYEQLEQGFERIKVEFSGRDLAGTDFQTAFSAANTLFNQLPQQGRRLRVIILLTDGQPSVAGSNISDHMNGLTNYARMYFPEPDYRIYTIGMIDVTDAYWQTVEPYWEKITNDPCTAGSCPEPTKDRASLVSSNDDVGKRFQEILLELTKELPVPGGVKYVDQDVIPGPLVVPPYVKSISFAYFKTDPNQKLVITDPLGSVDRNRSGVEMEGEIEPIQIMRISNPVPGIWQVATAPSGTDVNITMRYIFAQSRLDSPIDKGTQVQYVPVIVKYALLDDSGQPLPVYTDLLYRLVVKAEVSAGEQTWNLTLNSNADNTYSSEFIPVVTGPHIIKVHAESQDIDKRSVVVFDGEIGTFDVSPVIIVPKNLPLSWQQYQEQAITFELQDTRGQLVNAPDSLETLVTVSGEDEIPLRLTKQPDGSYQVMYTPNKAGKHVVHVMASVLDSAGVKQTVIDNDVGAFDVSPTVHVDMVVQKPEQMEQLDTELWPFRRNPMVIQVCLQDESDHSLDPAQVFLNNPDTGLSVVQIQDSQGNSLDLELNLQQTSEKGVYLAESLDFGVGNYVITIAGAELKSGYIYQTREIRVSVTRIRHPWHIPLLIAGLILLVGVISGSSLLVVRDRNLRKHPCKGLIKIADAYGSVKFQKRLDSYEKNKITLSGAELPPLSHVQKLQFSCESDTDYKNGRVIVHVWFNKDRTPAIDGRTMNPNGEIKLSKYPFWLSKDMDDIPEHREEQTDSLD